MARSSGAAGTGLGVLSQEGADDRSGAKQAAVQETDQSKPELFESGNNTLKNGSSFSEALVSIDWDFNAPPPALRCPITGSVVLAGYDPATGEFAEGVVKPNWEKIPTALFQYLSEIDEFTYIKPELQAVIDRKRQELSEDADDLDDFEILGEHVTNLGAAPLVFCLTTHGMACGPVSSSVYVGLDLAAGNGRGEA